MSRDAARSERLLAAVYAELTRESRRRIREDNMTPMPGEQQLSFVISRSERSLAPLDAAVDHVRGPSSGHLILEYGDYECPYSRAAHRQIQRVQRHLGDGLQFAFRHFPLTAIHPHALAAAAAAEAAFLQDRFWQMHELLFVRQTALEDEDLRSYAAELHLDVERFDEDRASGPMLRRVGRDVESALATGQVTGTPTLFIDGVVHRGGYQAAQLLETLRR